MGNVRSWQINNKKNVIIIQTRMGLTKLPIKVLKTVLGRRF